MLSWIVRGTTYTLDDNSITILEGHDGLGIPPLYRLTERGPLQNGVTDRGYRLDPRVIILKLAIKGDSYTDFYDRRETVVDMFKPTNTEGTLRWSLNGKTRDIKGFVIQGVEYFDADRDWIFQRVPVVLSCPDPRWYDPTLNSVDFNLAGGSDTFEVPLEIPFTLGASTIDTTKPIVYTGNVKSYPTIRITGPITDPVITNVETGLKLDFTGITIGAGVTYIIDLGYADNTVETSTGTNKISELTTDSDLVEFCIDPAYGGGTNNIRVTGSGITEATNVQVSYYDYYIGI